MNRRLFLMTGGSIGALSIVGRFGHQALARDQLRKRLVDTALSKLISKNNQESSYLPQETREEVRRWFHGKCLNAASFVREICTRQSREMLGSLKDETTRFVYLYGRFCERVVSHGEIMNRIETIQKETGDIIDRNWSTCCADFSASWGHEIRNFNSSFNLGDLPARLDPVIRLQLDAAVRGLGTAPRGEDPTRKLLDSLGRIAMIMLVPMTRCPQMMIPTFLVVGLSYFFDFIYKNASDPIAGEQAELSARIAHLGSRIGDEFETAIKNQLGEIHAFQESAVIRLATDDAQDAVPVFI